MQFQTDLKIASWGRIGQRVHQVARPRFVEDVREWSISNTAKRLAVGSRRSYSDVCLSDGEQLVDMTDLNRFRSFDRQTGILVAEAGVTIDQLLRAFVPRGYFVPVTPGTRFVTLGGAVANDVHGKNHHRVGTFGTHVESLTLERSDEGTLRVDPSHHPEIFSATIGGLGLTGIITEVGLKLQRIASSQMEVETIACGNLDDLCDGLATGDDLFEHNVAWIDCTASGKKLGRGLLSRSNWIDVGGLRAHGDRSRSMPTDRLGGLLNPMTLRAFNAAYYANGRLGPNHRIGHYSSFLYPLDSIDNWNRLYGRNGFYQYQCAIPEGAGREPIRDLLRLISASGEGSFLAVLKRFGDLPSPGMLSFPMAGLTLALDFRNRGDRTLALLGSLDRIVQEAGGRLYAAKDQRMPADMFKQGYPRLDRFRKLVDPACQSEFWRRVCA